MGRFNSEAVRSSYILRRLFKKVSLVFYQIRRGLTEREGFPGNASKEPACKCRRHVTCRFNHVGRIQGAKGPFDLQFLTWDFS